MRLAVLLLVTAVALASPASAATEGARPGASEVDARVERLADQLRCPVCQNLSVQDSPSSVAATFRARIRTLVLEGRSDAEIREFFVERYGDWILLSPPRRGLALTVWLVPLLAVIGGLIAVTICVRRWARRGRAVLALASGDPDQLARARSRLDRIEQELHSP